MADLLSPKELTLKDQDGTERTYLLSKIPAIPCREIVTQYPLTAIPKVSEYAANESIMMKLMAYVAVKTDGPAIRLTTKELINNHVPDFEMLAKIEMAMMEYNCSFLQGERLSNSLEGFVQKALALISKTLTQSSAASSPPGSPLSTNSPQSTH